MTITVSGADLRNLITLITGCAHVSEDRMSPPPTGEAFALRWGQYTDYTFDLGDAQVEVLRAHFEGKYIPRDIARGLGIE